MENTILEDKYRISIKEISSMGLIGTFVDVDGLNELLSFLHQEKVTRISLKFYSILDDIPNWYEAGIKVGELSEIHFRWLTTKSQGDSKFIEIDHKQKK